MKLLHKGQIQHVFLYMFAIIIIGALLLIGYKALTQVTAAGCDAAKESFKTDLLSYLEEYDTHGSLHDEKLPVPCGYTQICFLDSDVILNSAPVANPASQGGIMPDIIYDSAQSRAKNNIWLNKGTGWESVGFNEKAEIEGDTDNYICIKAKGSIFHIVFKGLGRRTRIQEPA